MCPLLQVHLATILLEWRVRDRSARPRDSVLRDTYKLMRALICSLRGVFACVDTCPKLPDSILLPMPPNLTLGERNPYGKIRGVGRGRSCVRRVEYRNSSRFSTGSSRGPYRGRVGGLTTSFDGEHGVEHEADITPPSYGDASNPFNQQRVSLEAVRDGNPAFCSIRSGLADLRTVRAVYESARERRTIAVG